MKNFSMLSIALLACTCLNRQTLELPAPQKTGGMHLMEALTRMEESRGRLNNQPLIENPFKD
jgi:hypothetical protein